MKVFAILFVEKNTAGENAIRTVYPNDHIQISDLSWLVSDDVTAKEVTEKLKISGGKRGSAVVVSTNGYFGLASTNIWEWMKTKLEATSNG